VLEQFILSKCSVLSQIISSVFVPFATVWLTKFDSFTEFDRVSRLDTLQDLSTTSTYSTIDESTAFRDLIYLHQHRDLIYLLHHVCRGLCVEIYQIASSIFILKWICLWTPITPKARKCQTNTRSLFIRMPD